MPGKIHQVQDEDVDRVMEESFTTCDQPGYISIKGFCLTESFNHFANTIENFKVRDDDIWVCSFPRTGTTWTQEMVWCIGNDFDFDGAKINIAERFPFLELSQVVEVKKKSAACPAFDMPEWFSDSLSFVDKLPSPRFIKCHLPFDLLPLEIREGTKKPKIVYVARNPKDACISHFHHSQLFRGYPGSLQDFCNVFLAGKICYGPYWNHVLGFWSRRNNENILFLKYEDMKTDHASVIRKTADFLGKSLNNGSESNNDTIDSNVEKLIKHLSFKNMKSNAAVNQQDLVKMCQKLKPTVSEATFIREGEKDQWKSEMSKEMCDRFDKLTRETFQKYDLDL